MLSLPPEARTFIPEGSRAVINCTANSNQSPAWAIQLPGRSLPLQFLIEASMTTLNNRGFYEILPELDSGVRRILRLLINSTLSNNGTVVGCVDAGSVWPLHRLKLISVILIMSSLLLTMPHHVRSTTSLSQPLQLVPCHLHWKLLLFTQPSAQQDATFSTCSNSLLLTLIDKC